MTKNGDLEIIKRLGKSLGIKIKQRPMEELKDLDNTGYCLDADGRVVGLNIYGQKGLDLSLLQDLRNLSFLSLMNNGLKDVSPLRPLTALTMLYLDYNQLVDVSPLSPLTALTTLDLRHNQLVDVSPLSPLTALTTLNLWNNQIVDVSPLRPLTALTELVLMDNQIVDISPLEYLTQLTALDISRNQIKHLPQWVGQFKGEIKWFSGGARTLGEPGLFLEQNPFQTPPIEIIKEGKGAIINYFKEIEADHIPFLHAKVLLVGQGEVGKTTLLKKLLDPNHAVEPGKEASTEGIDIQKWSMECLFDDGTTDDITLHFWDFGGQEIYHSTHQFFLTKRSLYIFVWEARKEEDERTFDYWLQIIDLLGGQSPVIMVMNKADARIKHINEAGFKKKYPNIRAFLQVSCLDGSGLPLLRQQLRDSLVQLPHLRNKLPRAWLDIRERLERDPRNYISLVEYYAICQTTGMDPKRADFLSQYLHDLGVILHFREDPVLENTVFLKPHWATGAVYKLIDTKAVIQKNGSFAFKDLEWIWPVDLYPRAIHLQLVSLMERFELCFAYTDSDRHFVPELLPPTPPAAIQFNRYRAADVLRFQYSYPFMPEGIISRFIARLSYLIRNKGSWKYGVELTFENTTALVQSFPRENRITMTIWGSSRGKLLGIIQANLEHIHETLNMKKNTHYLEQIPCNCTDCKGSEEPHFFGYDVLKRRLTKNKPDIDCLISDDKVDIEPLITGYLPPPPEKDLLQALLNAAYHLKGLAKTIKEDEDSRTSFIRLMLSLDGFDAHEQARWGSSGTGKSSGRVDLLVNLRETPKTAAVEAFILESRDTKVIDDHLTRIFYYDPLGGEENFILVYSHGKNFFGLWQKYLDYLEAKNWETLYRKLSGPDVTETPWSEIKRAQTTHLREGKETTIHHIFINMNPQKELKECKE